MNIYRRNDYDMIFKFVLLGDSGVGKSNILSRYLTNEFDKSSKATVGVEFGSKEFKIENDNKIIKVQIWDTAGQERYRSIAKSFYQGAKGYLFVYDITKKNSFDNINNWLSNTQNLVDETNISKILIGNKSDLESERQVKTDEGIEKAKELDMAFIETSAFNGNNIDEAFAKLINDVYRNNRDEIKKNKIKIEEEGTNIFQLQKGGFTSNIDCCIKSGFNMFN